MTNEQEAAAGHGGSLIREIDFLEKSIERLCERFSIEKKDALDARDIEHLEKLVDRSRSFFQPEAVALLNRLLRVSSRVREDENASEILVLCHDVEKLIRSSLSRFVATPHRLVRNFDALLRYDSGMQTGNE